MPLLGALHSGVQDCATNNERFKVIDASDSMFVIGSKDTREIGHFQEHKLYKKSENNARGMRIPSGP